MKVDYIGHLGTDLTTVNAARVSFDKESDWSWPEFGENRLHILTEKDEKLINYLAKHNHFTPFTHSIIQMRETVPIFVARQRFKHVVGFTYNEVSRRYVDSDPEFYQPKEWRGKPVNKKQGSSDEVIENFNNGGSVHWYVALHNQNCLSIYKDMIDSGIAPEQARMVLPQSMYTSYYVTGSLAAWARAYKLRSYSDAQQEIQELANEWNRIIEPLFPVSWKALTQ